jgi:hypothetical protein
MNFILAPIRNEIALSVFQNCERKFSEDERLACLLTPRNDDEERFNGNRFYR